MTSTATILAVDAGGTRCRAGIYGESGNVIAYTESGPSNYETVGADVVATVLADTLRQLTARAGDSIAVQCAVFGLAGLDTARDRTILQGVVQQALVESGISAEKVIVENDAIVALMGHLGGRPGIMVASGTGSIVCGQNQNTGFVRAGGWGHKVGDLGSGFSIGMAAIQHVFHVKDGIDPPSGVYETVLQAVGCSSVEALLEWMYGPAYSVTTVASLAIAVCQIAEQGDEKATEIVEQSAHALASLAKTVVKRLGLDVQGTALEVVLAGGVLQGCTLFRNTLIESLGRAYPQIAVTPHHHNAIYSAVMHGLRCLGELEESPN